MTYSFPFLVALAPIVISAFLLLVAVILWRKVRGASVVMGIFAAAFTIAFGPILFHDRVTVDDKRIEQRTGFWFAPTVKGLDLDGLALVTLTQGTDANGREYELWIAHYENGETLEIDPGDLWESNGAEIVAFLEERNVAVERSH